MTTRPRVILHNTVSLDGAISGFDVDIGLHYEIAGSLGAQAHLVGSWTARTGIESHGGVPQETERDRTPPPQRKEELRPLWVIVDSGGLLLDMLHVLRRAGYARSIVLLVSDATPRAYLDYLSQRQYPFHIVGDERVDLSAALRLLADSYGVERTLTDSGGTLAGVLLGQNLVDEVSLVVAPRIAPVDAPKLFGLVGDLQSLELRDHKTLRGGYVHLHYSVAVRLPES